MNRLFYKFVRALMWPVQKLLWPTTIIGRENFDGVHGKAILVCNHYSTVDSMIICCNLFKKYNNALVKSEAFKNPVERWFLYKMGCIPVHRGEADMQAVKNVFKVLRRDEKILVFPEGTRNKQGTKKLQQIKPGVAMFSIRMDAPVIPMMYYRMHKIGRRNYAIIGKPFKVTDYFDHKPTVDEGNVVVTEILTKLREEVTAYAEERLKAEGKSID